MTELRSMRSRLEREIENQRREGNDEVTYLRDQLRLQDRYNYIVKIRQTIDLSNELGEYRRRCTMLE